MKTSQWEGNQLPKLTNAQASLTKIIEVINNLGEKQSLEIPTERALTVYVDKKEIVTLMTLGAYPEWLVLGYLLNQRLINSALELESITVDWEVNAAAVKTYNGIVNLKKKTAKHIVTTGCGQGSMFGNLMDNIADIQLPESTINQSQLYSIVNTIRINDSVYKSAGSVHGCALFEGESMRVFIEDVGRHNALDSIAGWMAIHPEVIYNKIFYTTGRLTSEMIIKAAQMGVPIVISRSGITEMGYYIAQKLNLCAIGRATNKRFFCFTAPDRLVLGF
jgi:FdhD protein